MDRLYWEVFAKDAEGFANFIDTTVSFLHIYLGAVREAVAHSDQISKYGRVIYNESAWDTDKFKEIRDELTQPDHYSVIKEVLLRIQKYKCEKVDLGYVGAWKNPYQIAETPMPTGITVTYEKEEEMFTMKSIFFAPENWFNIQCKPLFKTDPIVEKDPKGSWNMNPVGLIAAKPEKCAGNRRAVFNMINDFIKEHKPLFTVLALNQVYYNATTNNAYIIDPDVKDNEERLPLMYSFKTGGGKLLYSDSSELPAAAYGSIMAENQRLYYEKKHFDFF